MKLLSVADHLCSLLFSSFSLPSLYSSSPLYLRQFSPSRLCAVTNDEPLSAAAPELSPLDHIPRCGEHSVSHFVERSDRNACTGRTRVLGFVRLRASVQIYAHCSRKNLLGISHYVAMSLTSCSCMRVLIDAIRLASRHAHAQFERAFVAGCSGAPWEDIVQMPGPSSWRSCVAILTSVSRLIMILCFQSPLQRG